MLGWALTFLVVALIANTIVLGRASTRLVAARELAGHSRPLPNER